MRVTIRTAHGMYLSAQPNGDFGLRNEPSLASDSWEMFDLHVVVPDTAPAPPPPAPEPLGPPPDIWTSDRAEVTKRVKYWLKAANSSDDEIYWVNMIIRMDGWTQDRYWANRIMIGDGAGKGYPG